MINNNNSLVLNTIRKLDVDENVRKALEDIFTYELEHGTDSNDTYKVTNCRRIISSRVNK